MEREHYDGLLEVRDRLYSLSASRASGDRQAWYLYDLACCLYHIAYRTKVPKHRTDKTHVDLVVNKHAWWIGAHYSAYNKRLCVTLIPTVTIAITFPGGLRP